MASRFPIFFFILLSFSPLILSVTGDSGSPLGLKEKLTHFKFYWQDVGSGENATSIVVVNGTESSPPFFGMIQVFDDALTSTPELSSELVGKAQGFYAFASQTEQALLQAMNLVFTEGKYNGSSITILGRNAIDEKVREMPVVGGSGVFRFARGYVEARTYNSSAATRYTNVEYNVYVLHYY